ncbi:MAG: SDR family oxidoreductase [Leptospiraceae bacterium]|nr:SDR family oxidoreductase [Leptospiraceae bacterium]MCP5494960.1 SDR family oxidoreductase [Leptospiraceae bacterium]
MELFNVKNKIVLITGATRGIGKSFAEGFRDAGAIVYGTGTKPESIEWMKSAGIEGRVADFTKGEGLKTVIDEIREKHVRLDCLINNAGLAMNVPAAYFKDEDIYKLIDINFVGAFKACQAYYKAQKRDGGVIINISSVLGIVGYSLSSVYSGMKGAVIQMTKSLAAEWVGSNFRINAICPGFMDTEMTDMLKSKPELMKKFNDGIPYKRMGKPIELLGPAIFLASDASSYMTGQILVIDGGLTGIIK